MTQFDDRLRGELDADDRAFLKQLEDNRGLFDQLGTTLEGPMGVWTKITLALILAATAFGLFAVWQMFAAETTRGLILWAGAAWAGWTVQVTAKKWLHDRMNTLTILREVKKLELRVARLEDRG